jgi:hypothetical protein
LSTVSRLGYCCSVGLATFMMPNTYQIFARFEPTLGEDLYEPAETL